MEKPCLEDYFKYGIGALVAVVYATTSVVQLFQTIPEQNREFITRSNGTSENILLLIFGFYFGSSLSARKNRDTLNSIAEKTSDTLTDVIKK